MKIYYGETQIDPNPKCKVQCVNVYCHKICGDMCSSQGLEGYIYNACTRKPVKHATIILENKFFKETCVTDCKGHYKIYLPCRNTWCKIKIKKHGRYRYYCCKLYVEKEKMNFKIYPRCSNYYK